MSYEEINQIARDAIQKSRQIELELDILMTVMIVLSVLMVILAVWIMWTGYRDHRARKRPWGQFRPCVTSDVQISPDGVEFRRMGVPGRR